MEKDLKEYEYLWNGSSPGWVLVRDREDDPRESGQYAIYNEMTSMLLLIEDSHIHNKVCDRLLSLKAKILDRIPRGKFKVDNLDIEAGGQGSQKRT
jgi:hypothetical protein